MGKQAKLRAATSAQPSAISVGGDTVQSATTDTCTRAQAVTESSEVTPVFSLIERRPKTELEIAALLFTLAQTVVSPTERTILTTANVQTTARYV